MVSKMGFEPTGTAFSGLRVYQLRHLDIVVGSAGVEPTSVRGDRVQGYNLLPADAPLQGLARASLTSEQLAAVRHGQAVQAEAHPRPPQGRRVRIYAPDGLFVGLAEARPDGWLQPRRLIHASAM